MTYLEKLVSTFDYFFAIFLVCNNIFRQKMIANLMVFRASIYRYCKYNQHVFVLLVFLKTVNLFWSQYRTADFTKTFLTEEMVGRGELPKPLLNYIFKTELFDL